MLTRHTLQEAAEALASKVEGILSDLPFHTAKNLEALIAQVRSLYSAKAKES